MGRAVCPRARICVLVLLASLAACSVLPSALERTEHAHALAQARGWISEDLETGRFLLRSFHPPETTSRVLTIYIEGDGLAWLSRRQPSSDPTPVTPLGLQLALAQPDGNAAYLGRPCQYIGTQRCTVQDWTDARFAADVISSTQQALNLLKARLGAQELVLVGYSGGAAIALLIAAQRTDVRQVLTVAGNLDPDAWSTWHKLQPLAASDNPARHLGALQTLPQVHLVGGRDSIMPAELARRFQAALPVESQSQVVEVSGYDHICCWADGWPALWERYANTGSASAVAE